MRIVLDTNVVISRYLTPRGRVNCIVTGDPHLLKIGVYQGIPILSPGGFLAQFFADE